MSSEFATRQNLRELDTADVMGEVAARMVGRAADLRGPDGRRACVSATAVRKPKAIGTT